MRAVFSRLYEGKPMLFHRFLRAAALLAGGALCLAAHAQGVSNAAATRPAAAAGLYQCESASGDTVFRSTPREGCALLSAPDPAAPDPQRWLPLMGANGVITYFDTTSVRRRDSQVGVVLMRNAPSGGVIRTTAGEPIASSLKRMVLDCATSTYAVVDQTLYSKRYARGEALYSIRAPESRAPQAATSGTIAGDLMNRLCH